MNKVISFRVDSRINDALNNLGVHGNKGQFIREAIHFYLDHHATLQGISQKLTEIERQMKSGKPVKESAEKDTQSFDRRRLINSVLSLKEDS